MKINNKKIIVSTLALAMGAALAGSISGSVAWYQYSTRAAAEIAGTSAGTEGRLQVAKHADSHTEADWSTKVDWAAANFRPLSITKANDGTLAFFDHPVYQVAQLRSASNGFADYEIDFRFQENTAQTQSWQNIAGQKIYLSHFAITSTVTDATKDVSPAVRVAFLDSSDKAVAILSKASAGGDTNTKGSLDLNKNNNPDTMYWDCQDAATVGGVAQTPIEYTVGADKYACDAYDDVVLTQSFIETNTYDLETPADAASIPSVALTGGSLKMRVWIEGWQLLNSKADWTSDYIAQNFSIELQFVTSALH